MDNKSNIDELFKKASNTEPVDFPIKEKLWNRLEERLERQEVAKSRNGWKKIAVAASVLLVFTLGIQLWNSAPHTNLQDERFYEQEPQKPLKKEQPSIISNETPSVESNPEAIQPQPSGSSSARPIATPSSIAITQSPKEIVQEITESNPTYDLDQTQAAYPIQSKEETKGEELNYQEDLGYNARRPARKTTSSNAKIHRSNMISQEEKSKPKQEALVVIDDKPILGKTQKETRELVKKTLANPSELDTITYLKEPLYIINGIEYSEEELFGENPTSPYAPLQKQFIEEMTILEKPDALRIYGAKAAKGVVIIRTKNGKPAAKK